MKSLVPIASLALAALMSNGPAHAADEGTPDVWLATWTAAAQPAFPGPVQRHDDRTLRLVVHASVGGERVRVRLSNAYGRVPLHVAAAHVALRTRDAAIDAASDRALTFGGRADVVIAPGDTVASDAVVLSVPALSDLAVSLHATGHVEATTVHALAQQMSYVARTRGDATGALRLPRAKAIDAWPFLVGVDVDAGPGGAAIVAFGDSWIDGDGSTPDANRRWTDALAARLQRAGGACARVAVLNEGLVGNRLLHDSPVHHAEGAPDFGRALGESGLARFDRDVLQQPGARVVVVHLGGNDLGFDGGVAPAGEAVSVARLVGGWRELIERAHRAGLRIVGSTLTPVEGASFLPGYDTPAKEALRQQANAWIRDSGEFDAVLDFDRAVRDPAHPARLLPAYASADHVHPDDAGYAAVAQAVPLSICELAARP